MPHCPSHTAESPLAQRRQPTPCGAPPSQIFRAQHAVLIGTGIGVTPFASILQSIMHRYWQERVDREERLNKQSIFLREPQPASRVWGRPLVTAGDDRPLATAGGQSGGSERAEDAERDDHREDEGERGRWRGRDSPFTTSKACHRVPHHHHLSVYYGDSAFSRSPPPGNTLWLEIPNLRQYYNKFDLRPPAKQKPLFSPNRGQILRVCNFVG